MDTEKLLPLIATSNKTSLADIFESIDTARKQGNWAPANGGTEQVFQARSGKRLLYCWQASTGTHAYLDVDSDLILSEEEARMHLNLY